MMNILLKNHLTSIISFIKSPVLIRSKYDLAKQMKYLNEKKQFVRALDLFHEYEKKNINEICNQSITQALKSCTQTKDLQCGLSLQKKFFSRLNTDSYLLTSFIHLYMLCGEVKRAEMLFYKSTNKSLSSYGALMNGYIKNSMSNKAIHLFQSIEKPDEILYIIFFNACAKIGEKATLDLLKRILQKIPEHFYLNSQLTSSLIDALMKSGDVEKAQLYFEKLSNKTLFSYGSMMNGFIKNRMPEKAIDLYHTIKNPDDVITILLINACGQLGTKQSLDLAKTVVLKSPKSFQLNYRYFPTLLDTFIRCKDYSNAEKIFSKMNKSLIAYGNLINAFKKENNYEKIIELFQQMNNDQIQPDFIICLTVIKALSEIGDYNLSKSLIKLIPKHFFTNQSIQNTLIHMWGKTGRIDYANKIFQEIDLKDHITYTAMINSYGLNGMGNQAVELFHQMPFELINDRTYVCILNACSHSGLIDQARLIFKKIQNKTEIIYTTMIDCLSRASFFDEAEELIKEFEENHPPSLPIYMALLSSVRNQNNSHLAEKIFKRLKYHFPEMNKLSIPASILLANIYAGTGEIDKSLDIRNKLNQSGVKKQTGLSSTVTNGKIYYFRAHDRSHPRTIEIYKEIEKISNELIEHGHEFNSKWIIKPIDENETIISHLCEHSEKIAVAWNFVENPNRSQIQITNNLRICGDCHSAIKLLAAIRKCTIIIRDANRIHHFYPSGKCSCQDYF